MKVHKFEFLSSVLLCALRSHSLSGFDESLIFSLCVPGVSAHIATRLWESLVEFKSVYRCKYLLEEFL